MSDDVLTKIAHHLLALFLLTLGLQPSEDEDTLEIRDYGPHRVFTQQARVPDTAISIDPGEVLTQLADYIDHHNAQPTADKFEPHDVALYKCPLGSGNYIYVSVSHTADT